MDIAQMPPSAASAIPIPDLDILLALIAFAHLVKVLLLECLVTAQLVAIALRTGQAKGITWWR